MATEALETLASRDQGWIVHVEYRARAALRQLSDAEQEAIDQALAVIVHHGWDPHHPSYLEVITLRDEHGPYYRVRLRQAPEVDLFVRLTDECTLVLSDVLRTELLRHVAESF